MAAVFILMYGLGAVVYMDFAVWYYVTTMNRIDEKARKFKGLLYKLWERL